MQALEPGVDFWLEGLGPVEKTRRAEALVQRLETSIGNLDDQDVFVVFAGSPTNVPFEAFTRAQLGVFDWGPCGTAFALQGRTAAALATPPVFDAATDETLVLALRSAAPIASWWPGAATARPDPDMPPHVSLWFDWGRLMRISGSLPIV